MAESTRNKINTFVFVDIEATGERDETVEITEISFIAVKRDALLRGNNVNPRLKHKLTICVKPQGPKGPNGYEGHAFNCKGIDHTMVENEAPFDANAADMINLFLNRLQKPICLIAHSVDWDFKRIKKTLNAIDKSLPNDILCTESLKRFKVYDKDNDPNLRMKKLKMYRVNNEEKEEVDYTLSKIFKRELPNEPEPSYHTAEGDAEALLKITIKYEKKYAGRSFVEYLDQAAKLFAAL